MRDVDRIVPPIEQLVITRDERAFVTDVAEAGAKRPVIVERK